MNSRKTLTCCCLSLVAGGLGCGSDTVDESKAPVTSGLPVCSSLADTGSTLPTLTAKTTDGGSSGWGTGSHVYALVGQTTDGWTLSLESGSPSTVEAVQDPDHLLASYKAGDRIAVAGTVTCQSYSGCKSYHVIRDAADGTLIAASYFHDSAIDAFSALLATAVSLEPTCRSAEADSCYPGAVIQRNQLRFAGNATPIAAGATGSVVLGGQTVRVSAGDLVTLSGGGPGVCLDAGSFFRGRQIFSLAR